jgi:hypothetical protein
LLNAHSHHPNFFIQVTQIFLVDFWICAIARCPYLHKELIPTINEQVNILDGNLFLVIIQKLNFGKSYGITFRNT